MLSIALPLVPDLFARTQSVDAQRIVRAVASSTAIETGQSVQEIESQLLSDSHFPTLELAAPGLGTP